MNRQLPPLNSLKSFEAAGRLLSFTKAAEELHVTQAAVSHQVKILEEFLTIDLFFRRPRSLVLTPQGKALLPVLGESFDKIVNVIELIRAEPVKNTVSVRLGPSFAAKWLSPRLNRFWARYAEIDLRLCHANPSSEFDIDAFDIAITYGQENCPSGACEPLFGIDYFPVCSPEFLHREKPLDKLANLHYYTLLHDATYDCWRDWLKLAGIEHINSASGTVIDDTNVLMQAALDGQGVALCSTMFVQKYLDSGRLIKPFDICLHNDNAYNICCAPEKLKIPAVKAFRDWLLEEAETVKSKTPYLDKQQ